MRVRFIFCFMLMFSLTIAAQNYSTWGEIYDYDVGDEFHYEETIYDHLYWMFRDINMEILEKTVSPGGDTITYLQFYKTYTILTDASSGYDEYFETFVLINPDQLFIVDSVYYSQNYNGRKVSYIDDSYNLVDIIEKYVDGCGRSNYLFRDMTGFPYEWFINLVYFKKEDEEWGTPNPVVGIDDLAQTKLSVLLYPNPTSNIIYISSTESIKEIHIFDQSGRQVLTQPCKENTIDVSSLERGLYFLTIQTKQGRACKKFVKQ